MRHPCCPHSAADISDDAAALAAVLRNGRLDDRDGQQLSWYDVLTLTLTLTVTLNLRCIAGFFNASLAARFGIISFDHNNAYKLWYRHIHSGHMPTGTTSEEYLVQQCAQVKQVNNRTKCFVAVNHHKQKATLFWPRLASS